MAVVHGHPQQYWPMVCPIRPTCPPDVSLLLLPVQAPTAWVRRVLRMCLSTVLGSCPQYDCVMLPLFCGPLLPLNQLTLEASGSLASLASLAACLSFILPAIPRRARYGEAPGLLLRTFDVKTELDLTTTLIWGQ